MTSFPANSMSYMLSRDLVANDLFILQGVEYLLHWPTR